MFSIISVKIKNNYYELTLFKVFCHYFFCTRGSRFVERYLICSSIFVNNNYIAEKKIDSAFVITRKSIKNLDVFLLNPQCVVLNIY